MDLQHLAIIMDGNGRWAEKKGLPRSSGHLEGGKAAVKVISSCLGRIPYLTLFCFSTENWKRPRGLPEAVLKALDKAVMETSECRNLTLQLAINYGGHDEITRAVRKAYSSGQHDFSEKSILSYLDNPEVPSPDYIARSGGEKRLSGFMLYQSSYAEIGFYDKLWPDWDGSMIDEIIRDYDSRNRRFGGI